MMSQIEIVKNIFLSHIKEEKNIDWKAITMGFVVYEKDPKPLYTEIYNLELSDPKEIISKLPKFYELFVEELAEGYVLDKSSVTNMEILESSLFKQKINFFTSLKNVITKHERKRIISELPKSYERASFNLSEEEIKEGIKKKARADLKGKFEVWDNELSVEKEDKQNSSLEIPKDNDDLPERSDDTTFGSDNEQKTKGKIIYLSWKNLVVAAAAVIICGVFIWQPTQSTNEDLFAYYSKNLSSLTEINFDVQRDTYISNSDEDLYTSDNSDENVYTSSNSDERGQDFVLENYTKLESDRVFLGLEYFQTSNYDQSKNILSEFNFKKKNDQLLLFLAISQLNTNDIDLAIANLEYLKKIPKYVFSDDVKFHLALGYIKKGDRKKAKILLIELIETENKFRNPARKILGKMRWF